MSSNNSWLDEKLYCLSILVGIHAQNGHFIYILFDTPPMHLFFVHDIWLFPLSADQITVFRQPGMRNEVVNKIYPMFSANSYF